MDWDDLKFFLTVSQSGSIRKAANLLEVNHSTVSRRISQLESSLGVRLFDKLPSGYVVTPAAEEIIQNVLDINEQASAIERKVFGRDTHLSGNLRITLPEALATHLLMPDIRRFTDSYPGIHLELVISDEEFNLSKREADIAIRVTSSSPPDYLVGRHLLTYGMCSYATPEYLAQCDIQSQPETANWLGWDDPEPLPQWVKNSDFPKSTIKHQVNHILVQLEAAKAGLGISTLPCFMADPEDSLIRVPGAKVHPSRDIWLLTHKDLRHIARVRTFMSYMADTIRGYREQLVG